MNTIRFVPYAGYLAFLVACGGPSVSQNLTWVAPVEYEDGSQLTNLAGYRMYRNGELVLDVSDPSRVEAEIRGEPGDIVFLTAYDANDVESKPSNEVAFPDLVAAEH